MRVGPEINEREYWVLCYILSPECWQCNVHTKSHCDAFALSLLSCKRNNTFSFYCCWCKCSCQQYESVQCCHVNGFLSSYKVFLTAVTNSMRACFLALVIRFANLNFCVTCRHLWPVWLYHVFPHCVINDGVFGKKLLNTKCTLWFFLKKFVWDVSVSEKN